jgi:hypothetical protein
MEYVKQFDTAANDLMIRVYKRPAMVSAVIHMLIILYATKLAPELPKSVLNIVNNPYFKLFIFSLILWTAKASPSTSILIALAFMITMNYANNKPLWEFLDNVDGNDESDLSQPVVAPTKEEAVSQAVDNVNIQKENPIVVDNIVQMDQTVYVTPKVIQTTQGPTVVNPTVVVTPAIVSDKNGQQYVIQPDMTLIQHAYVPEKSSSAAVSNLTKMTADVAEVQQVQSDDVPVDSTGCYPPRTFDLSNVSGVSPDDYLYSKF